MASIAVRCGRKPEDTLTTESGPYMHGALATQLRPRCALGRGHRSAAGAEPCGRRAGIALQDRSSNVIPFASYAAPRAGAEAPAKPATQKVAPQKPAPQKTAAKRTRPVVEGQGTLDFLPQAQAKPRQLGTTVEAVIYCEAPVATTLHRAVAAALDWSMVLIGYGMFLTAFHLLGGEFDLTKSNIVVFGAMFLLIGFSYGLFFSLAGAETAGMHWTQLRLTTFDGFPPERKQRLVRFGAASLARCTLLGLLWSLADEESLAWHDHISRTFPTPSELDTLVFRRR
jgi:uncharacterized RDD family membrane protein YckC